ncbi:MAG: O-antigen ligase family protein [Candidatus Omnitrophota bacterium]|nr:O-antigen ligase family protein [Candidatus Omnitrophota bacterium]
MLKVLLTFIFIRPFISSLAFPYLNSLYSALFLIFLIIWIIYKGISIRKIQPLKYPLALFCLALIIAVVFSIDKLNSLKELYKYITGILLFLIVASLTYENKIRLIHTIILAGFIISLLAIYQYFFGFQHILDYMSKEKVTNPFALDYIQRRRAFFPFVTPNTLAGYFIMIIPLTSIHKNRFWLILPLSFAFLLTKSLGALLSSFLALVIYFHLQGKLERKRVVFLFGLLVIVGLVFMARATTQKQHLQPIFSTVMRLNYWKDTLRMIKAKPLTGVGLGNFNLTLSRYAHNSYLQIWTEMGISGIISILWLIIVVFKSTVKNIKVSLNKNLMAGLITANASFLIHNLVDFSFFLPEVTFIWWVILGLSSE